MWSQSIEVTAGQIVVASCEVTATEAGQGARLTVDPLGLVVEFDADTGSVSASTIEMVNYLDATLVVQGLGKTTRLNVSLTALSEGALTFTWTETSDAVLATPNLVLE